MTAYSLFLLQAINWVLTRESFRILTSYSKIIDDFEEMKLLIFVTRNHFLFPMAMSDKPMGKLNVGRINFSVSNTERRI